MTKILIIKTSSMGDILHTLPALTDAGKKLSHVSFDWVVEESFMEIPKWHPLVDKVMPIAWRRLRKKPLELFSRGELFTFLKELRKIKYDYIIDAQGLIKSAMITRFARGLRCGLDKHSAWEKLASLAYQRKIQVLPTQHAITRMRQIFSRSLGYPLEDSLPDYQVTFAKTLATKKQPYLLFIHGTTWKTKEWPEKYWQQLVALASKKFSVLLPWGNETERLRAQNIAASHQNVEVLPPTSLTQIANLLSHACGVVSVDTGLSHLAAALSVPTVSLYGPTDPNEVGTLGKHQRHLVASFVCSPCFRKECGYTADSIVKPACFEMISPQVVWEELNKAISLATQ